MSLVFRLSKVYNLAARSRISVHSSVVGSRYLATVVAVDTDAAKEVKPVLTMEETRKKLPGNIMY